MTILILLIYIADRHQWV